MSLGIGFPPLYRLVQRASLALDHRLRLAVFALIFSWTSSALGQLTIDTVKFVDPAPGDRQISVLFSLPDPVTVTGWAVTANGSELDKSKLRFEPTDKINNFTCAVLILVDKTIAATGESSEAGGAKNTRDLYLKSVRLSLSKFEASTETRPYVLGLATISSGNLLFLAGLGEKSKVFDDAVKRLKLEGQSKELYLGLKEAIRKLTSVTADRKFLILYSDGVSGDQDASAAEVVALAKQSNVRICTLGYQALGKDAEVAERLANLAEETGGLHYQTDGSELRFPIDTETNLLKFIASGGRLTADLSGLSAPLKLSFQILTSVNNTYLFNHTLAAFAVVATPTPAPTPTPSLKPKPTPWPALLHSGFHLWRWLQKNGLWLMPGSLTIIAIGLALGALRTRTRQPVLPSPDSVTIEPTEQGDWENAYLNSTIVARPANSPLPTQIMPEEPVTETQWNVLAWLEGLDPDQGRYPITKPAIRIGRKSDNDIVLRNDTVSGYHADIYLNGSQFMISDLDSANQVYVGGRRVEKAFLQDGDIIELGEARFRFLEQR